MLPLAVSVAILDTHTRLTRLETSTPLFAAFGAADVDLVHQRTREMARIEIARNGRASKEEN
jgi:hypothetical protein